MLALLRNALLLSTILLGILIGGSFVTKISYGLFCNPTRLWGFAFSIHRGKLEARYGREVLPDPSFVDGFELSRGYRGDPLLNAVQLQRIGGLCGINLWRVYISGSRRGNGPLVIDTTAYKLAVTIDPSPAIVLCILAAVFPAWALRRDYLRRHRAKANLCLSCGYDLRASPTRCPECGTVAQERKKAVM